MLTKFPTHRAARLLRHSSIRRATVAAAATHQPNWAGHVNPEIYVSANSATTEAEWSQQFSFASRDSNFSVGDVTRNTNTINNKNNHFDKQLLQVAANGATMESAWAEQIILADAQKDVRALQEAIAVDSTAINATDMERMMGQLLLMSPESALGVTHVAETMDAKSREELKAIFTKAGQELPKALPDDSVTSNIDQQAMDLMLQHMLLSSPESATGFVHAAETLTEDLKSDLAMAVKPLPTTMEEALREDESRAIVITSTKAPFRIVRVNHVWEDLCGYSQAEAENKPIGELLMGPETKTARHMVDALKQNPEHRQAASLINYTKDGRKFHNHLQVGPLYRSNGEHIVDYLVGVLQEVDEDRLQKRMRA